MWRSFCFRNKQLSPFKCNFINQFVNTESSHLTTGKGCSIYLKVVQVLRDQSCFPPINRKQNKKMIVNSFDLTKKPEHIQLLLLCLCVSFKQTQRTMAFAGMLSEENIKAAVQACQGQSRYPFRITKTRKNTFRIRTNALIKSYFLFHGKRTCIQFTRQPWGRRAVTN